MHASWIKSFLGVNAPPVFVELAQRILKYVDEDRDRFLKFIDEVFAINAIGGFDQRYNTTPTEMFPFGSLGCDGVHYGIVMRAPELGLRDLPIAEYQPMDSFGAFQLGSNTIEAFENLCSGQFAFALEEGDDKRAERIRQQSEAVGIRCDSAYSGREFTSDGTGREISVDVPEGWSFTPSSDGIGVLAPDNWFDRAVEIPTDWRKACRERQVWAIADRAFEQGKLATALSYYREIRWNSILSADEELNLHQRLEALYRAMGRNVLARVHESIIMQMKISLLKNKC